MMSGEDRRPNHSGRFAACAVVLLAVFVAALALGPRVLPFQTFFVRSGSMRPALPVGSLAFYTPIESRDLHVGDVIVFRRPDGTRELVTHRIVRIETGSAGKQFVTKGDANGVPDPWRIPASGGGWRYRFSVPYVGYVAGLIGSPVARLALLVAFALGAAATALGAIWRRRPATAPA
jgi:signal peptidase